MICEQKRRCWPNLSYLLVFITAALSSVCVQAQIPSSAPLVQSNNLSYLGSFKLPSGPLGTTYGFSYAGTGGLGTYALTFNPTNNSLFIGGHPYEQKIAEIAIPNTFSGTPTATVLQNLIDPLEGKLPSINPPDPNTKIIGSAFVYNNQLYLSGISYYDGAATQTKSQFVRPTNLSTKGQVQGPFKVGNTYPGWVNRYASAIPPEWQPTFGGQVLVGGSGGAIDSLQSWGPSASIINPTDVGNVDPVPAALVLGYPITHPLSDYKIANPYWSANTIITGIAFPQGSRSVLYFGQQGLSAYCYGGGTSDPALHGKPAGDGVIWCYDPVDSSKGNHSYPYVAYVWAYDANELIAVKNGKKHSWEVLPYAVWTLETSFHTMQGVGYDPVMQRLYVSVACQVDDCAPLIRVYQINNIVGSTPAPTPTVTISASPTSITSGSTSTLSWSTTDATSCTASGAWSGAKATSGSQSTGILSANVTFTLTCIGAGGSVSQSAILTVTSESTPPPSSTVTISNVSGLQSAIAELTSNQTILLADGTYNISGTLYLPQNISNVTIKGASGNRDAVVIKGPGMTNSTVAFGFWADGINGVTFQDMTIRDFNQHAIILNGGVDNPAYRNLHIIDIGDQFLKNNPTADRLNGVDNGLLENSLLEYSSSAPDYYTNGVDVHRGKNWIIRGNTFKNFKSADGLAGPVILMWNGSSDTTVVRNTFINNQRDISFGLDPSVPADQNPDHARGLIANNFIYKTGSINPDVPVAVFDSPQTKAYYNTILLNGSYPNAIEYRFSRTTGVDIKNNLTDASIAARDGASGSLGNNVTNVTASSFVNPAAGDLHLKQNATAAIDKGVAVSVTDDFDGQARPQGAASDIGADEYNITTTVPAAPNNLALH